MKQFKVYFGHWLKSFKTQMKWTQNWSDQIWSLKRSISPPKARKWPNVLQVERIWEGSAKVEKKESWTNTFWTMENKADKRNKVEEKEILRKMSYERKVNRSGDLTPRLSLKRLSFRLKDIQAVSLWCTSITCRTLNRGLLTLTSCRFSQSSLNRCNNNLKEFILFRATEQPRQGTPPFCCHLCLWPATMQ